tara:strand:- start:3415 stop:3855 length:441 start_codon:yes stop_codon:yes gene_type:complete
MVHTSRPCIYRQCEACKKIYDQNLPRRRRRPSRTPYPRAISRIPLPEIYPYETIPYESINIPRQISPKNVSVDKDCMKCPIGHEMMIDPVIAEDGITYERKNIEHWFTYSLTSPITRQNINSHLLPNLAIKQLINSSKNFNIRNHK